MMEMADPIIDGNGQTVQEDNVAKDSYKTKLMGVLSIPNGDVCMDEDFKLQDTDGTIEMLLDLENDFYLVHFQNKGDFDKVLLGGPWVVFGYYLSVRAWSADFLTSNSEVDKQVVWIQLLGLFEGFYSDFSLRAIESMIRLVFQIDAGTDAAVRERFTRLVVNVDLQKPLVSKIRINGRIRRITQYLFLVWALWPQLDAVLREFKSQISNLGPRRRNLAHE
ncbi:hypothetical protein Golob_002609 [Gossypium lobatum]|uniref:DUF4283 domain-containing protein n=1 Tax=Gossypium lobatum TaxID=34289 RepID=A0A7J8N5X3_9ROSI|nr:hypothetical protein [Gossypium lobatum]